VPTAEAGTKGWLTILMSPGWFRTWCESCLRLQIYSLNQVKVGNGDVKSPFTKGGFRGISQGIAKSPLTPLEERGAQERFFRVTLIVKHTTRFQDFAAAPWHNPNHP
jgi:hypothetical protein